MLWRWSDRAPGEVTSVPLEGILEPEGSLKQQSPTSNTPKCSPAEQELHPTAGAANISLTTLPE